MTYTETMRDRAHTAFTALHEGVGSLAFSDFPDYDNIGDSAIALGQHRFWTEAGITITHTSSRQATPRALFRSETTVAINGGGNFGGLYPELWEHKLRLAEELPAQTLLIQEPQSVVFPSQCDRDSFLERMAPRERLRIAVRDHHSFEQLRPDVDELHLAPDAVHLLGAIDAPAPSRERVVLARQDAESAHGRTVEDALDWPRDPLALAAHAWWSRRTTELPALTPLFQHSTAGWMARAEQRFATGVEILAAGEVIVTDRLHAMLIGLQLGRSVVAIDNSNRKLRNYAETWLEDAGADLTFTTAERAFGAH